MHDVAVYAVGVVILAVLGTVCHYVYEHERFISVAMGRRASHGVTASPSVLEEVEQLKTDMATVVEDMGDVKDAVQQLRRNSGSSVADAVYDSQRQLGAITESLRELNEHVRGDEV